MSLKKILAQSGPALGTAVGAGIGLAAGGPGGAMLGATVGGQFGKAAGEAAGGKYAPQKASSLPQAKAQDRARVQRTYGTISDSPSVPETPPFGDSGISDSTDV
jgi:hypothetical protein